MSEHLTIAAVTAVLRDRLQRSANKALSGAQVTWKRPDAREAAAQDTPGLNLFLYRVAPSPQLQNLDIPTRTAAGGRRAISELALDLEYLVTFYGPNVRSQLLLAQVVADLHVAPQLTPADIDGALKSSSSLFQGESAEESSIRGQKPRIRLKVVPLALEELSKLWSVFLQVPYDLSIVIQASPVLLRPESELDEVRRVEEVHIEGLE